MHEFPFRMNVILYWENTKHFDLRELSNYSKFKATKDNKLFGETHQNECAMETQFRDSRNVLDETKFLRWCDHISGLILPLWKFQDLISICIENKLCTNVTLTNSHFQIWYIISRSNMILFLYIFILVCEWYRLSLVWKICLSSIIAFTGK